MLNWSQIRNVQLDIVGIVAILGEGSTTRNAQASALGWHNILPRLLPAPQALLKHEHAKRLPTVPGTVVGAYSGNVRFELNYFCQLLHPDNLGPNQVELVKVTYKRKKQKGSVSTSTKGQKHQPKEQDEHETADDDEPEEEQNSPRQLQSNGSRKQAFYIKRVNILAFLSVLGSGMSVALAVLSFHFDDGFAFLAIFFLSFTSSIVGFASWWRLDFFEDPPRERSQQDRKGAIPDSDVVIFYPKQGAFRIVRCNETISRLYFKAERCEYVVGDNVYRIAALWASLFLMSGLLCLSNSQTHMQIRFAASYMGLNAIYWGFSALNPMGNWGHWRHQYVCKPKRVAFALDSGKEFPRRHDTDRSFRNENAIPLEPLRIFSSTGGLYVNNLDTASPVQLSPTNSHLSPPDFRNIRLRKVTFHDDDPSITDSNSSTNNTTQTTVIEDGGKEPSPPKLMKKTMQPDTVSATAKAHVHRQNTKDLEGLKHRSLRVGGSLVNHLVKQLDRHRLIPKQYSDPSQDSSHKDGTFTTALWKTIAITGSTLWLNQTHIAPDNEVWQKWINEAGKRAASYNNQHGQRVAAHKIDSNGCIQLPSWDYQGKLSELFAEQSDLNKRRPPRGAQLKDPEIEHHVEGGITVKKVKHFSPWIETKLKKLAADARSRSAARKRVRRENTMAHFDHWLYQENRGTPRSRLQDALKKHSLP